VTVRLISGCSPNRAQWMFPIRLIATAIAAFRPAHCSPSSSPIANRRYSHLRWSALSTLRGRPLRISVTVVDDNTVTCSCLFPSL
jgi:hypothetical protein